MKKQVSYIIILILAIVLIQLTGSEHAKACNVAVVTANASATGRPFLWKNRDHPDSYRHEVIYYPEVVSGVGGSLRLMGETLFDQGAVCTGGSNESGFAIANTTCVDTDNDPFDIDNVNTELLERALERCVTLEDFENLAHQFTSIWTDKNISGIFGVIDARGGAAVYEMWTDGNNHPIMYYKYVAEDGTVFDEDGIMVVDEDGTVLVSGFSLRYPPTKDFINRTNSNHVEGWIEIWSDDPRELRARQQMTDMLGSDTLSPRNMMTGVARDVCGDNPEDYCLSTNVRNDWNYSSGGVIDRYNNPNRTGQMYTRYCISRYKTSMGLIIEGVAPGQDPALTTMWVSLCEPSLSVFVPYFPAAEQVSKYAYHNSHSNTGYYWDGLSTSSDSEDNSFLNLLFDCVQANPFNSDYFPELRSLYDAISLYRNNGAGPYADMNNRNDGEFYLRIAGQNIYYMDSTINYPRLLAVQTWTQPIEDFVNDRTEEFIDYIQQNPAAMTAENLAEFSHYCNYYVYENYSHQSSSYRLWDYELPPDGVPPVVVAGSPYPAAGSTTAGINPVVHVRFNEPMNETSVNSDTFTLYVGTRRISGTVDYDPVTYTASFTPSSDLNYSTYYRATVTDSVTDRTGTPLAADFTWNFTTMEDPGYGDGNPPLVSPLRPSGGETDVLTDAVVTMQFSEAMDQSTMVPANIRMYRGTIRMYGSVTYHADDHTLTFDPYSDLAVDTTYTVCVYTGAEDLSGLGMAEDATWTFTTGKYSSAGDGNAPQVTSVNPASGDTNISLDSVITIHFSEILDADTVSAETILVSDAYDDIDGEVSYNASTSTAFFTPLTNLAADTDYTVTVLKDIKDPSGLEMDDNISWTFRTGSTTTAGDGIRPRIESVSPVMGAESVSTSIIIVIQFSEDMDRDTVNDATILLAGGSGPVGYAVEYNEAGKYARVIPDTNFDENESYTVTVLNSVLDESGLGLANDVAWSFTTGSSTPAGDAPELEYVSPMPDSSGVNPAVVIAVKFDDDMDENTIDENSFILTPDGDTTPVDGDVSYDAANRYAILTPDAPMNYDTKYNVTIAGTMSNSEGQTLGDDYTWSFTTGSAASTISTAPLQIVSVSPAPDSAGVSPAAVIRVQFNKSMDEVSLNTESISLYTGTNEVAGQVDYSPSTMTATFRPGGSLAYAASYMAHVSRDVYDTWGYSLDEDYTWNFSTSAKSKPPEDGCFNNANASTYGSGRSSKYPGLISLLITMLFPFSLIRLHRKLRRKKC